jgi:biotin operon repressor
MDLHNLAEATAAYCQALTLFQDLGQSNYALDARAGLARVSLIQGDLAQALDQVEETLSHWERGTVEFSSEPSVIYLACYQVLQAAQDPRAQKFLVSAHTLLQDRAARIPDAEMRHSYLENVAAHKEITTAYRALQTLGQREVRLPQADAPTGRPLHEEEYASVTWTVAAPEDETLDEGPTRRQARLLRLLREAAAQGAAPTVGILAAALDVSEPTVRRDLAALRRAGHPVQTRGSRGRRPGREDVIARLGAG